MAKNIETEATILTVTDDAKWKYSIEADIPAFDGDRSYRYLAWNKKQGPPPQVGAVGRGTFEGYARSKFYVDRGDLPAGPYDGTETQYHVTWNFIAFAEEATNGVGATRSATPAPTTPVRAATGGSGTIYLPAPTPAERLARELAKFQREAEGVNDRKAVSDILSMVEPGTYTLDGLIQDAEILAAWYNQRVERRLIESIPDQAEHLIFDPPNNNQPQDTGIDSPLVEKAKVIGTEVSAIKNRPDLDSYVKEKGWAKADISRVIQDAGHASSAQYLADSSNSVQGLAQLLKDALGSW